MKYKQEDQPIVQYWRAELGNGFATPKGLIVEVGKGAFFKKGRQVTRTVGVVLEEIISPFLPEIKRNNFVGLEGWAVGLKWPEPNESMPDNLNCKLFFAHREKLHGAYERLTGEIADDKQKHYLERVVGRIVAREAQDISRQLGYKDNAWGTTRVLLPYIGMKPNTNCEIDVALVANEDVLPILEERMEKKYWLVRYEKAVAFLRRAEGAGKISNAATEVNTEVMKKVLEDYLPVPAEA